MSSSKVSNSFASYQENKQRRREQYIEAYLKVAKKSRQRYEYVTDLARAVSNYISVNEKREGISSADCNPATLLRNDRYKSLLLNYLADSASPGLKNVKKGSVILGPAETSIALLSQIEMSNLRLENQRLKYHIADLERALEIKGDSTGVFAEATSGSDNGVALAEMEFKYISSCQVVMAILSKFHDILTVDIGKNQILDATVRRGDNVIIGGRLTEPFFSWLKKHSTGI